MWERNGDAQGSHITITEQVLSLFLLSEVPLGSLVSVQPQQGQQDKSRINHLYLVEQFQT